MSWWLRFRNRSLIAVTVGLMVAALFALLPAPWDTALLTGWDVGASIWLILTCVAIGRADPASRAPVPFRKGLAG